MIREGGEGNCGGAGGHNGDSQPKPKGGKDRLAGEKGGRNCSVCSPPSSSRAMMGG